jgi:hypothetical protein
VYPTSPYNSGDAGGSIGWNFSSGGGEMTFMNNYNISTQGFHFRQRSGTASSVILCAMNAIGNPPGGITGTCHIGNVNASGQYLLAPSVDNGSNVLQGTAPDRTRRLEQRTYAGTFADGQVSQQLVRSSFGGHVSALAQGGNGRSATFLGYAVRSGSGRAWITINKTTSTGVDWGLSATSEGFWSLYLTNNGSGAPAQWSVSWLMDPNID